jgi:hypothetical protein
VIPAERRQRESIAEVSSSWNQLAGTRLIRSDPPPSDEMKGQDEEIFEVYKVRGRKMRDLL